MLTLMLTALAFAAIGGVVGFLLRPWIAVIALPLIGIGLAGIASLTQDPNAADVGHNDMSDEAGAVLAILFYVVPAGLGCLAGFTAEYVRRSDWLT